MSGDYSMVHFPTLTRRENEIMQYLADGKHGAKFIASRLNISTKTVETHFSNIIRKIRDAEFDCHSRLAALVIWMEHQKFLREVAIQQGEQYAIRNPS